MTPPRAIILCPGPSLALFLRQSGVASRQSVAPEREDGSATPDSRPIAIGVNRAACGFECDYWSAADHETIGRVDPLGKPILFAPQQALRLAAERFPRLGGARGRLHPTWTVTHECVAAGTTCPLSIGGAGWKQNSMLAAIILAESLGVQRIDLYGCDFAGNQDWDGRALSTDCRTEARWKHDMGLYDHIVSWLNSRGVHIERHTPDISGGLEPRLRATRRAPGGAL